MKRRNARGLSAACLLLLGLGAAGAEAAGDGETGPVAVRAEPLVGVVVASRVLDVSCQAEGTLEQLRVRLGERVKAGQVLAALDLRPLQLELAVRQAALDASKVELGRAKILLTQAEQRLERERRVAEYSAAQDVETAENQLQLARADVELAQARMAQAQAQLALAASNLEQAQVRAPFSGAVSEVYLQPGATVRRGAPVVRLVAEELRLRFAVPESRAGSVQPGTAVRVRLQAVEVVLQGTVDNVSPEIDSASRHIWAEARLQIPDSLRSRIPTGLLAQVEPLTPP